jgi:DNA invertase Pin-like site-specific DNA recombinase
MGRFVARIIAEIGQLERELIGERTSGGTRS